MDEAQIALKLLVAWALGGVIGLERENTGHPAGLRTHNLVSLGACLVTMVGMGISPESGDKFRIAAKVVSGIGFLGAGTILRDGATVKGLTTAASLWVVAGIGLAVGAGFMLGALVSTLLVAITLVALPMLEARMPYRDVLNVTLAQGSADLGELLASLQEIGLSAKAVAMSKNECSVILTFRVEGMSASRRSEVLARLTGLGSVSNAWFARREG